MKSVILSSKKLNSQKNLFLDLNNTLMYSEDIQQQTIVPLEEINKISEVVEVEKSSDQLESTQSNQHQHGKNVFKIHIFNKENVFKKHFDSWNRN